MEAAAPLLKNVVLFLASSYALHTCALLWWMALDGNVAAAQSTSRQNVSGGHLNPCVSVVAWA